MALYTLLQPHTQNNVDYRVGDPIELSAPDAAFLRAIGKVGEPIAAPTPLQVAEARHTTLARSKRCCY
ncbi:MAG TPA: hypothetical protein PLD46_01320 [Hyphomicrobium sp.]|nr:hypothetical protein [Hyphomicrobium sp.]